MKELFITLPSYFEDKYIEFRSYMFHVNNDLEIILHEYVKYHEFIDDGYIQQIDYWKMDLNTKSITKEQIIEELYKNNQFEYLKFMIHKQIYDNLKYTLQEE